MVAIPCTSTWSSKQIPASERNGPIEQLAAILSAHRARGERRPQINFDPERLRRKRYGG
jgi:hypothetical protein